MISGRCGGISFQRSAFTVLSVEGNLWSRVFWLGLGPGAAAGPLGDAVVRGAEEPEGGFDYVRWVQPVRTDAGGGTARGCRWGLCTRRWRRR